MMKMNGNIPCLYSARIEMESVIFYLLKEQYFGSMKDQKRKLSIEYNSDLVKLQAWEKQSPQIDECLCFLAFWVLLKCDKMPKIRQNVGKFNLGD